MTVKLLTVTLLLVTATSVNGKSRQHAKSKFAQDDYRSNFKQSSVEDIEDIPYWDNLGRSEIDLALQETVQNTGVAKNVILFIGDGMSIPTITAARIFKAQQMNQDFERPEKEYLSFERMPFLGHSKTYDIDYQVADSASTASAMYSGVKTKYYTLGFDSHIDHYDVTSMLTANEVETILNWAQEAGKHTGVVTTARITHATPAAAYAKSFDRDWECDTDYSGTYPIPEGLHDIAWQLVNKSPGNTTNVLIGGGSSSFFPYTRREWLRGQHSPQTQSWEACYRGDGLELAYQWLENHGDRASLALNRLDLLGVDAANTDYLFGLMGEDHVAYDDERDPILDPTLTEMVEKALEILMKNPNGFFLVVEGGRIDHAHHDVLATRALSETVALDMAFERIREILKDQLDETLMIVTADHAHTMTINGYPARGQDIRGLSGRLMDDDLPYTTLAYTNGKAYYVNNIASETGQVTRLNLSTMNFEDVVSYEHEKTSAMYRESETHGGDDVAIFASGPMAHLFHTTHEQTYIAHVMSFSSCIGPYKDDPRRCQAHNKNKEGT